MSWSSKRAVVLAAILCLLIAACGDESTEPTNQRPSTPVISPTGFTMVPEGSVLLTASATDPDGDQVSYSWTFGSGSPASASGPSVTWTAPDCTCDVSVAVEVSDGKGGESSESITVSVHPNAGFSYGVPFEGTLDADLSQLAEGKRAPAAVPGTCHFWASAAVTWTNLAVTVFTGLPTIAFLEALTHPPVWFPPATWLWAYTVPWGSTLATVELYATLTDATHLDWQMLISGTLQQYEHFQWVTGTSLTDANGGHWLLYDHRVPNDQIEALRIEWAIQAMDNRDLDYLNVLEGSTTYGDSLSYSRRGTDAEVRLHDVSEGTSFSVLWDTAEGNGMLIGASGDSCCWGPAPLFEDLETCE